ncbi:hypothetical protein DPEC_G00066300 [Dallia pectoralis]|uniref:Uncharacterized protein n=1 Tax=Dallia pectoralis TaxID=75939 RepID=A0ACC2H853_DALPE|nr:hypothetical protein DPEC_G00066300 [Dallia pectoralis]
MGMFNRHQVACLLLRAFLRRCCLFKGSIMRRYFRAIAKHQSDHQDMTLLDYFFRKQKLKPTQPHGTTTIFTDWPFINDISNEGPTQNKLTGHINGTQER